jgi:hypothetical protein
MCLAVWSTSFLMRFRRQILAFLAKNFDLEAFPSPVRALAQDQICIPYFRKQITKLHLTRSIFFEPQFAETTRLNQDTIAALLKVLQPLIPRSKVDRQFHGHTADISDGARPSLTSPERREKLLQWLRYTCTQTS